MLALRVFAARRSLHCTISRFSEQKYFTKKHEWVSIKGEVGTVGITDFATEQLGDVVYVEVPTVGSTVSQGDAVGAVESVKAASDIYSPVSGSIVESNEKLGEEPGLLNKSPFGDGWLYKLKVKDSAELKTLMDTHAYEEFKKNEEADH